MNISWGVSVNLDKISKSNGYGTATGHIVTELRQLGYHVKQSDARADVHFHFDQPQHFDSPRDDMYKVLYHPWESSELQEGWLDIFNSCDEVWATSPLVARWYQEAGIEVPIYVFEHGVESKIWVPKARERSNPLKFLHVGGEAARRGLDQTIRAFRETFADNKDVELTIKTMPDGWDVPSFGKIKVFGKSLSVEELVGMHHDHHVFIQPSSGEGFGLSPLQAMATGMPTIIPPVWAPYSDYLDPNLTVETTLRRSQWPKVHPGKMFRPELESIKNALLYAYENYEQAEAFAQSQVAGIAEKYNWNLLTQQAFSDLEHRLNFR